MRISEGSLPRVESMTASCGSAEDDSFATTVGIDSLPATPIPVEEVLYRGEGNANLVVALPRANKLFNRPTSRRLGEVREVMQSLYERKVIRFRKSLPEEVSADGGKQRVARDQEFARNVVSNFFGSYAEVPEILRCDTRDIARLTNAIRTLRPDKRRQKEITEVYATKLPDYTFLRVKLEPDLVRNKSTFCVEIKPKQGYLSKEEPSLQKCPYCLTQYYKLRKGVITTRSTYCPFDLFSGEQKRMDSALKGLLNSPQNNLKIFKDGIMVYDQDSSACDLEYVLAEWFRNSVDHSKDAHIEKFCELVRVALLSSFAQEQPTATFDYNLLRARQDLTPVVSNSETFTKAKKILYFAAEECDVNRENLPQDSVLERILLMQRLPYINADHVYYTYAKFSSLLTDDLIYSSLIRSPECYQPSSRKQVGGYCKNTELLKRYIRLSTNTSFAIQTRFDAPVEDDPDRNGHIKESMNSDALMSDSSTPIGYLQQNNSHKSDVIMKADDIDCNEQTTALISIENLLALQNYLLFLVARDCSILMAFQELNSNDLSSVPYEHVLKISDDQYFFCDIGISDVDPKSVHSIGKHPKRDADVLNAVITMLEEELALKNQSAG